MKNGVDAKGYNVTNGSATNGPLANEDCTNRVPTNDHSKKGMSTNGGSTSDTLMNGHSNNSVPLGGHPTNDYGSNDILAHGLDEISYTGQIPIAICGMACRLSGGIKSPQELWEFLLAKKDGRCRVPESRYKVSSYYSPTNKPGSIATEYGFFLDKSVDLGALDTSFFSLPRSEVEQADPQQRLMLEVARECFEDAGVTNWRGKPIGCYIGNNGEDWLEMHSKETQQYDLHRIAGIGDFVISNRLSYEFDIKGPRYDITVGEFVNGPRTNPSW